MGERDMYDRPRFKPHFKVQIIEDDNAVFLLSEEGYYALQGRLYCLLAPYLDGRYSVDDIIELLAGKASIAEIYYALELMDNKDYITEARDDFPAEQLAFWSALGVEAGAVTEKLKKNRVTVLALGSDSTLPLQSMLQEMQVGIVAEAELTLVLVDDYLQPELAKLNQQFLQENKSWVLAKASGTVPWLGPLFIPGDTACWECLAQRLKNNRNVEEYVRQKQGLVSPVNVSSAALPTTRQMVWNMLAIETIRYLLTGQCLFSQGHMITLDTRTMKTSTHTLTKRPQCSACGQSAAIHKVPPPPRIQSCRKTFILDGGHRYITPEATLQKFGHHVSPITGVVKYLNNAAEADPFLKVYHSGHNFAVNYGNLAYLRNGLRS